MNKISVLLGFFVLSSLYITDSLDITELRAADSGVVGQLANVQGIVKVDDVIFNLIQTL